MYSHLVKKYGALAKKIQKSKDNKLIKFLHSPFRNRVVEEVEIEIEVEVDVENEEEVENFLEEAIPHIDIDQRPFHVFASDNQNVHTTVAVNQSK